MKITLEMSESAYVTAKKVYAGSLTRSKGKFEIAKATGMNKNSAHAFITIFLAMMKGEEYKRAFINEVSDVRVISGAPFVL